jgi:hypothetical protein
MKNQTNLVDSTVANFKNVVEELMKERSDWQTNHFKSSNDVLYDLLAKIYELYLQSKGGEEADANKRTWLIEQCKERKINFKRNKPTMIQLITKLVFYDSLVDSRRVNSYARVLNVAAQSPKVQVSSDVPKFIKAYGGIEEVRAATAKNTKSPSERAEFGRKLLANKATIKTLDNETVKANAATVKGTVVLLVGIATAKGDVEVKEVCFEVADSKDLISNKTAIKTVLSSVYSTDCRRNKDIDQKLTVEEDSQNQQARLLHADKTDETIDTVELAVA